MSEPQPYDRRTLKPRHRLVVRALADALLSPDGEVDFLRLDALVGEVDRFISPASKTLRFGLLVMLDVIRWMPLFMVGKLALFETLARADRTRMLEAMEKSRITQLTLIAVAYKTMLAILFYESEEELRAIGYPGHERHRYKRALPRAPEAPT